MQIRRLALCTFAVGLMLALSANGARAQGLFWQLPAENEMVHYEGTYKQTTLHPAAPGGKGSGNEVAEWICHLTIKSLGSEEAEFEGKKQKCRWLEIKVINGKSLEGLDAGPVGTRIYKVLVPESRIVNKLVDANSIPNSFLPVVKGTRKIGNKEATPIESGVLQLYPVVSVLMNYSWLKAEGEATDLSIRQGEETSAPKKPIKATVYKAGNQMEHPTGRSINSAKIWQSPDVPFGVAKWEVQLNVSAKEPNDSIDKLKPVSKVEVEMHVVYQKGDAQPDPSL